MSSKRKSKSKAKAKANRSPSISPSVSSVHSLEEGSSRNRKRMAPESNELGEDVRPSPTKRFKKPTPGSHEFESQPAVVITAKHSYKPLRRKLSFGSAVSVEADKVPITEENTLEDEEVSLVGNVQRSRRLSQKAAYMADTPTRKRAAESAVKSHATKTVVVATPAEDTDMGSGVVLSSPKKRPVPRPTKKPEAVPAVKHEEVSDVEIWPASQQKRPVPRPTKKPEAVPAVKYDEVSDVELGPASQQLKRKAPARLESPIDISSDESNSEQFPDTPKVKGRPSGIIPKALESQRTPRVLPATAAMEETDIVSGATPKKKSAPHHQSKGKAPARLESPVIVSNDESGSDQISDTPKPKGRPSVIIPKALEKRRAPQASPTASTMADTMKEDFLSPTAAGSELDTGVADAAPSGILCTIRPADSNKTPANAPADLRDPETDKPIFLQNEIFSSIFEDPMLSSIMASLNFKSLPPFVNPSNFPSGDLTMSDYRNVIWPNSKGNAVCMMFGAVYSCNIIHYAMAGPNKIRALTIIPSSTSFDGFRRFLWNLYDTPDIYGPFDYGCLLTFTSRREGLTSSYGPSQSQVPPDNRKRNMKLFRSSATSDPATHWYEKNFPPFVNYDQDIPIYDASSRPFMFTKEDFAALPSFPRYKRAGDPKNAEVPTNGLVTVFFGMNTYVSTRLPATPGSARSYQNDPQTPAGGSSSQVSSSSQVLSLNLHFVIYHGQAPDSDEDN